MSAVALGAKGEAKNAILSSIAASATEDPSCGSPLRRSSSGYEGREPLGFLAKKDEVGSVNEVVFEKIFLPELQRLSDRYGGLGMHCYADARHQWLRNTRVVLDVPARDIDKAARLADQLQVIRQKLY